MKEPHVIYVEKYGILTSGKELQQDDFGENRETDSGGYEFEEYDVKRKLAVSLAARDANKRSMRTKSEFEEEINRLQS